MLNWILENSLLTAFVMLAVFGICRLNRNRPALCHLLWMLALLSLVMPPVPIEVAPGTRLRVVLTRWLKPDVASSPSVDFASELTFAGELDSAPFVNAPGAAIPVAVGGLESSSASGWLERITWVQGLLVLWGVGALVLCGLAVSRILCFHRLVKRAPAASDSLTDVVAEVAARLGIQAPAIRMLEGIGSPAIWCFGPPLLLWPTVAGKALRHTGERSLIAHELAHVARRDHWVSRLDVLAIGLYWWNPLFWIIRHEVRHYAELSCDAWALWAYPTGRRDFAEALIESQERTQCATTAIEGLCATHSEFKHFERRLTMIMRTNVSKQVSKGAATVAILTSLLVLPGISGDGECQPAVCEGSAARTCIDTELELTQLSWNAEQHFRNKEFAQAAALYTEVLDRDPMNGKAHARLGYMLCGSGELEGAKQHFTSQFKLGHEVSTAVYNLACANALGGDNEQAAKYLEQAVRRGFANHELMTQDTDISSLRESSAYHWALKAAAKSAALRVELKSDSVGADVAKRAAIYDSLAEICSEDGEVQNDAGLNYLLAKNYTAGLQAFQRQAAAGYDVARAHYNMACAHALLGQPAEALTALEAAVAGGMAYANIHEDADLASLRGMPRFDAAAEQIQAPSLFKQRLKAAKTPGEVGAVTQTLVELKSDTGRTPEVRAWAAFELGRLQLRTEQQTASITSFQEAASLGFATERAAFQIAEAHARLGNKEQAMSFFDQSVRLGFAEPKTLQWGLELCGMAQSDAGLALIEQSGQWKKAESKSKTDWEQWNATEASVKEEAKPMTSDVPSNESSVSGLRF